MIFEIYICLQRNAKDEKESGLHDEKVGKKTKKPWFNRIKLTVVPLV